jgi:hypothetical protein
MKNILLGCILLMTYTFADGSMSMTTPADIVDAERTNSVSQLPAKPIRPRRPATKYLLVNQDNYYYTNVLSDCDEYLEIIEENEKEIEALKKEIDRLRSVAQAQLQKKLSEKHAKEMKKFDERKSGIRTQNRMNISNEPVK